MTALMRQSRANEDGKEKGMSRLAGAGGAAECALMNDNTDPGQPEAGGGQGVIMGVHET